MRTRNERALRVAIALARLDGCILCRAAAELVGIYLPDDSVAWGAKPGEQQGVAYALCDRCFQRRDLEAIEARLAGGRRAA
jgi:hypothetical protein